MGTYNQYAEYTPDGYPLDWQTKRLRFAMHMNPSKNQICLEPSELVSFVPMEAVGEYGGIDLSEEKELSEIGSGYTYFSDNDVVVAKITPCFENGKGSLANGLKNKTAFGTTELHVLRANSEELDSQFLFYLTISDLFRKLGESEMYGAGGQKRVPERFFKNFRAGLPSIPEQQTIAAFLNYKTAKIDALIAKKKALLEKLLEKRTALISHAVTKGLDPNAPMRDSGIDWLGEIPAHWEVQRLKYLGRLQNGINIGGEHFGSGYPFVSYGDVYNNRILPTTVNGLLQSSPIDRQRYSIKARDVFFTITSETIEEIGFPSVCLQIIEDGVFAGFLIRFRPNSTEIVDTFGMYYFQNNFLRAFFVKEMNIVTRASLSQELLGMMPVLLPPQDEQRQIASYLNEEMSLLNALEDRIKQLITHLQEYRSALITNAVTGKIDVRSFRFPEDHITGEADAQRN